MTDLPPRTANRYWHTRDLVAEYAGRELRPAEVMVLVNWRDELRGRVLEVGCGAGRVSGYLIRLAEAYTGIDVSPAMLEHCRRRYPTGRFELRDLRDLDRDAPQDAIAVTFNTLDVVSAAERRRWLDLAREVIVPGGLLVFSGHNLAAEGAIRPPWRITWRGPVRTAADVVRMPGRTRNRVRLRRQEERGDTWAVLNDEGHGFSALHYYTRRDDQERQLAEHGFELLECLDLDGNAVPPGAVAADCPELHYVARRTAG